MLIACITVTNAALTADDPSGAWWVGGVAAVWSGALFAAADRTTVGNWPLAAALAGSILAFLVTVWWFAAASLLGLVPPLLFGLGVGTGANRLLFGVVYPLPAPRRRRENAA